MSNHHKKVVNNHHRVVEVSNHHQREATPLKVEAVASQVGTILILHILTHPSLLLLSTQTSPLMER